MEQRDLGRTGMSVSTLCLGTMMFGAWGEKDHDESVRIIHAALDAGINFVDTADIYAQGESEEILGKALTGARRDEVILATKAHGQMGEKDGGTNRRGNSRRWITKEVESSLERLQTDWIDLYQMHRHEPDTDHEETLGVLTDLQRAGKIRAFGCSTFPAHEIVRAHWTSEKRMLGRYVTEQPPYSILTREIERDVLPVCADFGMGVIPWSPLAGGWLTGRYRKGQEAPESHRASMTGGRMEKDSGANADKLEAADALAQLAEEAGISLIHMALAFTLAHPAITAPIIGPRTMEQLESQLGAGDVVLSKDVLDRIDVIVPPGVTLGQDDALYGSVFTEEAARRRRPSGLA
ncbi:MAG: aldo/keto reductase [Solirubrobacterales bacterium]|nr:aldo/keto reductase [Solirubrobacterales bacterium]